MAPSIITSIRIGSKSFPAAEIANHLPPGEYSGTWCAYGISLGHTTNTSTDQDESGLTAEVELLTDVGNKGTRQVIVDVPSLRIYDAATHQLLF